MPTNLATCPPNFDSTGNEWEESFHVKGVINPYDSEYLNY